MPVMTASRLPNWAMGWPMEASKRTRRMLPPGQGHYRYERAGARLEAQPRPHLFGRVGGEVGEQAFERGDVGHGERLLEVGGGLAEAAPQHGQRRLAQPFRLAPGLALGERFLIEG